MVGSDKFKRSKKLLEEIEFNKNFKLKIFHEKLKENWQKLSADEQIFLCENLKKKLFEATNKGNFTNPALFDDVVKILLHFYNLIELKQRSLPEFTFEPFEQQQFPMTVRIYMKNNGFKEGAFNKHTILVNEEIYSLDDLVNADDKIVILPILHGGENDL